MKRHPFLSSGLMAGEFLLMGTLTLAQTTAPTGSASKAQPAVSAKPAAVTTLQPRDAVSGHATGKRQDQFGHASGLATDNADAGAQTADKSLGSAHATESLQKKHIAGVKYEDRAVAPTEGAGSDEPGRMGINEQGVPGRPSVNKMAIKENGISKLTAKAASVQPYKDPEDMTTRSRQGITPRQ